MPARFHQHCLATALLAWSVGGFSAVAVAAPAVVDAEPAAETTDLVDDYFTQLAEPDGAEAAAAGARCLGVEAEMCGLLTTPQLHWMVMCRNKGQPWGEADYYAALAGAYKQLVATRPTTSS